MRGIEKLYFQIHLSDSVFRTHAWDPLGCHCDGLKKKLLDFSTVKCNFENKNFILKWMEFNCLVSLKYKKNRTNRLCFKRQKEPFKENSQIKMDITCRLWKCDQVEEIQKENWIWSPTAFEPGFFRHYLPLISVEWGLEFPTGLASPNESMCLQTKNKI